EALSSMAARLEELRRLPGTLDYDTTRNQLFSIEGRAAQDYWSLVGHVLGSRVAFQGRQRKGATDLFNSLLNYGYAVLQARVHLALVRAGLAPQISFLHALQRRGAPTLAFDLMEEFRPHVVDRTILSMIGRREALGVDDQELLTEATRHRLIG